MEQISAESILSAKLTSRLDFPMRPLIDDQVDRRKVEVWQHMEPKRTNRSIDFLCFSCLNLPLVDKDKRTFDQLFVCIYNGSRVQFKRICYKNRSGYTLIKKQRISQSVLIALGKRLFSFRTQKLSPVAAIILFRGR